MLIATTVPGNPAVAGAYQSLAAEMARTMQQFTDAEQQVIHRYVTATIEVLREQTDRLQSAPTRPSGR